MFMLSYNFWWFNPNPVLLETPLIALDTVSIFNVKEGTLIFKIYLQST